MRSQAAIWEPFQCKMIRYWETMSLSLKFVKGTCIIGLDFHQFMVTEQFCSRTFN